MSKSYSPEEVSKHDNAGDLWIAIHGKVYDITKFLNAHPGGEEVLLDLAGTDATKCFDEIGHSQDAKTLRDGFEIGMLEGEFKQVAKTSTAEPTVDDDNWEYQEPKKESNNNIPIFIGIAVLVYAIIFAYYFF